MTCFASAAAGDCESAINWVTVGLAMSTSGLSLTQQAHAALTGMALLRSSHIGMKKGRHTALSSRQHLWTHATGTRRVQHPRSLLHTGTQAHPST